MKYSQPKFPLAFDTVDKEDINALCGWLQKGERLSKGDLTIEFEKRWAEYIGTKYSVFCNSGSSANLLMAASLLYSNKLKNKKVIVPSVGWVTTISSFIQLGFEPIMCGANDTNFGLNLDGLEKLCKEHNPSVVIVVNVLGFPNDIVKLLELQKKFGFYLLEDSCAALGSEYYNPGNIEHGYRVGLLSDMSSFSFYFGHQLSTIEGGMVNTDNEELYHLLLMLRSHGWGKDLPKEKYKELIDKYQINDFHSPFTFFVPGMNLRSTDLQAFLGLRQIKKANWVSEQRNKNHKFYYKLLHNDFFMQEYTDDHFVSSISIGVLADNVKYQRKNIVKRLIKNDIETRIFSAGNLGLHPFWYERYGIFNDRMSNDIHYNGFFLPNTPTLKEEEIEFICDVVKYS